MKKSVFEKHPRLTLAGVLLLFGLAGIAGLELAAGSLFGLGHPVIYESHPVYGYRPEPNQFVARNKNDVVKINNLGLRANQDWDLNQPQHKILFLGDSVTYGGSYIHNDQLFSSLAIKSFAGYESGNAGVNGWGVDNVYALVKEMHFLPADVYVSVFPEGDFYRGLTRIGGQPFWTKKPRFALEELFHYFIYKIQQRQVPPIHFYEMTTAQRTHIANLAVRNLKALDEYLKSEGKTHLIYISPSRSQILKTQTEDLALKQLFQDHKLHVVYLKDRLQSIPASQAAAYFHDEIHLSIAGHQQWAALIEPDLKQALLAQEQLSYENKNS
ncbi:SGNH/GDSL hydrolase family protein [Candidatus Berkiella aquae]|uniref:SGNH/GDSL hydrolase family protein n=1 Tax=Candidatus Berkiella aquae TaxID=295108 RepID=A0A0Q9YW50_9GAMM|nr:SGNH/GDSL hydrolase family protein [Candidatus Berkiella aquae]MCS5712294.1 SGNH/GDSL hydrolase family protein [Candidatus Berkiella aquae]